jgi:hypothetical protein
VGTWICTVGGAKSFCKGGEAMLMVHTFIRLMLVAVVQTISMIMALRMTLLTMMTMAMLLLLVLLLVANVHYVFC